MKLTTGDLFFPVLKHIAMKHIIVLIIVLFACIATQAQPALKAEYKIDSLGNYVSAKSVALKATSMTTTGKYFVDSKGIRYPVWKTSTGRLVYLKTSAKTGNVYKVYLDTVK